MAERRDWWVARLFAFLPLILFMYSGRHAWWPIFWFFGVAPVGIWLYFVGFSEGDMRQAARGQRIESDLRSKVDGLRDRVESLEDLLFEAKSYVDRDDLLDQIDAALQASGRPSPTA